MTQDEIRNLITNGIKQQSDIWADFGCGAGNFTLALQELLGDDATIHAVDKDPHALNQLHKRLPQVKIIQADFTKPLDLPPLDGILMANALHFIMRQEAMLQRIHDSLKPAGQFIIVEYDIALPRGYIPFPVPFSRLPGLVRNMDFTELQEIGRRVSPRDGTAMYAASMKKADDVQ